MTTEAPQAGTDADEDESYLSRLLLLHPECDPELVDAPAPVPPAAPRVVAPPVGLGGRSGPTIAYDGDGWISVVPEEPPAPPAPVEVTPAAPPAPPPAGPDQPALAAAPATSWWRRYGAYLGVIAIIAVVAGAMALAPGGERPVLLSGVPTSDGAPAEPLTEEWVLEKINLQYSEVSEGYVQVFDRSIDPFGTNGCTQPTRDDGVVASASTAYAYRPDHLDGFAAGHVASTVAVFDDEESAARRARHDGDPDYLDCLRGWDEATWFGDSPLQAKAQDITAVPAALEGRTLVGARYTATYDAADGRSYPAYTDHIVVTTGRVRVWLELSSVLYPFDPERRDLILGNILERVDDAAA